MTHTCPACQSPVERVVADIGSVPVYCNVLWPDRESALSAKRGEIVLGYCDRCGLIHNLAFDPSKVDYTSDYENSLHFSPRFQAFATALAEELVARHDVRGGQVMDIGCGKGDFLRLLCDAGGNTGVGFDESFEPELLSGDESFTVVRDIFTDDYLDHEADLVSCRHVLEHIIEPASFLERVRRVASNRDGTVVYFEVPNALYTVDDLGIWDIIYEHCTYYSSPALASAFSRAGIHPHRVWTDFGNQFLCIEAKLSPTDEVLVVEPSLGALSARIDAFAAHYTDKRRRWREQLAAWHATGRKVAVWGAGSKGVTFLNVAGSDPVTAVVDINPRKHGRFVAGAGLEVVSPDALIDAPVDVVLVMNPVYRDEIAGMLAERGLTPEIDVV